MRIIKVHLSIGLANAYQKDDIAVEDAATEDEIEEQVQLWASNYIDVSWSEE